MKSPSLSTRTGKIARLPRDIRQQLNHRLDDGESAQELVAWLNETPAVKERLARYFDWQRHQESHAVLREILSEAEELGEEVGEELLMDRVVKRQKPRVIAANRA